MVCKIFSESGEKISTNIYRVNGNILNASGSFLIIATNYASTCKQSVHLLTYTGSNLNYFDIQTIIDGGMNISFTPTSMTTGVIESGDGVGALMVYEF